MPVTPDNVRCLAGFAGTVKLNQFTIISIEEFWTEIYPLQADIHIAKFNVTWNHPTHDVLLTRDEAP